MEFMYDLKIPKERVAVLIGKDGETKKEIETNTHSKIYIDSEEGYVQISGEDSLALYTAREVIKAIARGFNPEIAKLLLRPDYVFIMVNITDYATKAKKSFERLRGRVIGEEGKSRKIIEQHTETFISVYGKTISIIGEAEDVDAAKAAIESLLAGSTHSSVFRWLEKKKRELARRKTETITEEDIKRGTDDGADENN